MDANGNFLGLSPCNVAIGRSVRFRALKLPGGEEGNGRQQKAEIKYRSMTIDRSDKHDALDLNPLSHLVLPFFLPRPPPRL
jgi:hypothetical protein